MFHPFLAPTCQQRLWTSNEQGRGPAWSNSLFEDNGRFGLGIKLATDKKREMACDC
jgi:pyruvate-ferredoxin/flavodoxin oxidoreductase